MMVNDICSLDSKIRCCFILKIYFGEGKIIPNVLKEKLNDLKNIKNKNYT
jgi:hypothetical protein